MLSVYIAVITNIQGQGMLKSVVAASRAAFFLSGLLSILLSILMISASVARAQVELVITGGVEAGFPIAVVPFGGNSPEPIARIVDSNLSKTGQFQTLDRNTFPQNPTSASQINFPAWQGSSPDYILVGQVNNQGGQYVVQYQLVDSINQEIVDSGRFPPVNASILRRVGHKLSDIILEKVTGLGGAFDSRLAYVAVSGSKVGGATYSLVVSDSDGSKPQTILTINDGLIMGPAWSPDGTRIAFSEKRGRGNYAIKVWDSRSGKITTITNFPRINSSPAWAPDGRMLLVSLSKDGSPDIYSVSSSGGKPRRLTTSGTNETEPCYTQDGQILYTSNRGGNGQIYRMGPGGGGGERVSFAGKQSLGAACSPTDAYQMAMVTNMGNGDQVVVYNLYNQKLVPVSDGGLDQSPSWAPNGHMVIYTTRQGGREKLTVASADGLARQVLESSGGNSIRDPDWGPLLP